MNRLDTLTPPDSLTPRDPETFAADRGDVANAHGGTARAAAPKRINVGQTERKVSLGVGAGLVGAGLLHGKLSGLLLAGVGVLVANRGLTGHCVTYEKLGVDTAAGDRTDPADYYEGGVKIEEAVTVNKPAQELYDYFRDLTNAPKFMPHVERVDVESGGIGGRSHWVAKGPAGVTVEYDAETINDEPGRLISWQTLGGADVHHAGAARFVDAPGGRGTEVRLNIEYLPPAGFVGRFGSKLLRLIGQAPQNDVRQSLRNFKMLMEAGQITSNAGPQGT